MIIVKDIFKSYESLNIINSFSYNFPETGFILLFGESGSGKTTLLNILSGMIPFDSGTISVDGIENTTRVQFDSYKGGYDYITQDTFFVDYLSVIENLKIISSNENKICDVLTEFGLIAIKDNSPPTLSGGERQRLALARTLLSPQNVIFLDEPTASLDKENKVKIFELLKKMSHSKLIICSSHDRDAGNYADSIINFEKTDDLQLNKNKPYDKQKSHKNNNYDSSYRPKDKKLYEYTAKWFSSKTRGKKTEMLLFIFLTIAMCLCMLSDTPISKLYSNMEYIYRVNSLRISAKSENDNYYMSLEGKNGVKDVVITYSGSLPMQQSVVDGEMIINYDLILFAIPFEKEHFNLSNSLIAGTYFKEKNDILLSYEMAEQLSGGDFNSLIGQTIEISPYAKGKTTVKIVGIFDKLNDFEAQYLKSSGISYEAGDSYNPDNYRNLFFLNSIFVDDYLKDSNFNNNGQRMYQLYFDNFENMISYYEKFDESYGYVYLETLSANIEDSFVLLSVILLSLAALTMLLSVLFYANLIGTELAYNNKFISVFHYSGYRMKDIISCFIRCCILRLFLVCIASAIASALITSIFNLINYRMVLIGFQVFTYNIWLILSFIIIMCISAIISVQVFMRRVKTKTWYENLVTTQDLL